MDSPSKVLKNEIDLWDLMKPSLGYLLVFYICLVSGNLFREGVSSSSEAIKLLLIKPGQLLFFASVLPYYLQRAVIYDRKENFKEIDKSVINLSKHFPLIITATLVIAILYMYLWIYRHNNRPFLVEEFSTYIIVIIPYIYFFGKERKTWLGFIQHANDIEKSKAYLIKHFTFRNYIFFPALLTCFIPFLFGYIDNKNPYFILAGFLIPIYDLLSKNIENKRKVLTFHIPDFCILIITLIISFVAVTSNPNDYTNIKSISCLLILFTVGLYMTMIMLVSESWFYMKDEKNLLIDLNVNADLLRTIINSDNQGVGEYKISIDLRKEYEKNLKFGTYFFPITLPLLILLPTANNIFILLILFAYFKYIFWNIFEDHIRKVHFWKTSKIIFGLITPILIGLSLNPSPKYRFSQQIFSGFNNTTLTLLLTLFITSFTLVSSFLPKYYFPLYKRINFEDDYKKKWVTGFIASTLIGLSCLLFFVISELTNNEIDPTSSAKLKVIIISCIFLNLIIILVIPFILNLYISEENKIIQS